MKDERSQRLMLNYFFILLQNCGFSPLSAKTHIRTIVSVQQR